jgi:chromodomain-helicase-DNA-binding protein 3/chromodomain-helicase-DNA-binding protein 4
MVYRLVSKYTVEEKIVENATKKLMLGEMIINPVDQSKADKGVIDSILRHGAMELFDKTVDQENEDEITEDKLEELLHRGE